MSTPTASGRVNDHGGPAPELDQLIAGLRVGAGHDPQIADQLVAAASEWRRPPRIQVTGRARAGKTTLLQALALMSAVETEPVDEPGRPDPVLDGDLVVYVVSASLQAADRRILAELPRDRTIVVLNKADAIGSQWSEAVTTADQIAYGLGVPVLPLVSALAVRTRAGTPSDDDLRTLRRHAANTDPNFTLSPELFTAPAAGPDVAERTEVLQRWGLYGVSCALAALRYEPELGPRELLQLLHAVSGIDPVHDLLHRRYEQIGAQRGGALRYEPELGPRELLQLLHAVSGIDPVHDLLHRRYEQIGAQRGGAFLDELARLAARSVPGVSASATRGRDLIEDYLAGDEALWLGLQAGLACPDVQHLATGYPAPQPADADDALARAQRWRAVVASDMPAPARRAAVRVHNGYVRIWERMSSAGL